MVKHHLRRTLGRSALTADVFETILVEVEAIINSRPITFLSHDQTFSQPLSPSDFLMPLKVVFRQLSSLTQNTFLNKKLSRDVARTLGEAVAGT
uniref:Uncharacterized protein n=1 Tax=Ditylenchus dipsaci TaxID=166011 RepID=A0A915DC71_9BILA